LKFCLTILHGQGLEAKKALKATYNTLVSKKASVKVALAAERSAADHLDDIADFWCEFINEGESKMREEEPRLRREINSEKIYCQKPEIIYEAESSSICKVNSMDQADPDRDDLLEMPPLRSNKSMSTAASSDLQDQQQQQSSKHHKSKGFKGSCGGKRGNERRGEEPKGKVVIAAKPAPVVAALAAAEKC